MLLPEVLDPDSFAVGLACGLVLGAFVALAAVRDALGRGKR